MLESVVTIINPLGMHARAAAQLVHLANNFNCSITLQRLDNNVLADAKSILSVLTMAAARGTELRLVCDGKDAKEAFEALQNLIEQGFGEI
jgi:phosphotransferase system HPr (HPr) family protein